MCVNVAVSESPPDRRARIASLVPSSAAEDTVHTAAIGLTQTEWPARGMAVRSRLGGRGLWVA